MTKFQLYVQTGVVYLHFTFSFRLHLGSDWIWHTDCKDNKYLDILKLFEDTKDAIYGIHRISLMGESTDGKAVGTWFGPNTVAQAIRQDFN